MKNIVRVNARELKSLDDNKFTPKPVYQTEEMKVVLAYFKPGQFIPVHSPRVDVVLCVLDGEAEIVAGDELVTAKKDDLIIVPKGHKRGVKALSELTLPGRRTTMRCTGNLRGDNLTRSHLKNRI